MHYYTGNPQNYHTFVLFDPPKIGNPMTPVQTWAFFASSFRKKTGKPHVEEMKSSRSGPVSGFPGTAAVSWWAGFCESPMGSKVK